jgi:hypothetical protein
MENAKVAIPAVPDVEVVNKELYWRHEADPEPELPIALTANPPQNRRLEELF